MSATAILICGHVRSVVGHESGGDTQADEHGEQVVEVERLGEHRAARPIEQGGLFAHGPFIARADQHGQGTQRRVLPQPP